MALSCRLCYVECMGKKPNELNLDFLAVAGKEAAREAAETARRAGIPVVGFHAPTVSEGIYDDADWKGIFYGKTVKLTPTPEQSTISKTVRSQKNTG